MASLNLTGGENEMSWQITGLGGAFNTSNYMGAAIASSYQGDGISSLSYYAYSSAPSSRSAYSTPVYTRWMSAGTYTFYGYARAANGKYYYAGADSCVVTEPEPEPTIPTFDVDTVTPYGFDINVYDTSDYPWVRYAVYVGDTSTNVLDVWVNTGGSFNYYRVTGLQPSTRYRINVYYATGRYTYDGDWIGTQYHYTNAEPTYTYYYRARLFVDGSIYDYTDGSITSTISSGYNFSLQEVRDMVSIPSHTSFSRAANGNSYCSYSNGYFTLLSSSQTYRAYMDLYYTTDQYTVTAGFYDTLSRNALTITGAGTYDYGTTITLRANLTDSSQFAFDGWYDSSYSLYSTSAGISITVTGNVTFYAKAKSNTFTVSAQAGSGYSAMFSDVSVSPTTVQSGGTATFSATLVSGYEFTGWYNGSGTLISSSNPYSPTITSNLALYARAALSAFAWTYSHAAGTSSVSKAEWRRLQTFINRKRTAAGQSAYSFSAFKGYMTPLLFNEAAEAIGIDDRVSHGEAIRKAHFTRLATAANNM